MTINRAWLAGAAALSVLGAASTSAANTMKVTYFDVAETNGVSPDADFQHTGCCSGQYTNEVLGTLGTDGLPVYNTTYGGPTLNDVNGAGELTWWSPSFNTNVTQTGTGTVTLPISNNNMYQPNGTGHNDANGFETAVYTGVLHVPTTETVTFDVASDDDAFLALNNTVIDQVGGIHPVWNPGSVTETLGPGNYDLTLFYADRYQVDAALDFSVDGRGVTLNGGVPEPASWAMMLFGVGAVGSVLRRSRKRADLAVAA